MTILSKLRKRLVLPGVVAVAATTAMAGIAEAATWRYADIGPPRGPRAEALKWWAQELEERTKGEIKIKFFWSQSLVKGKETLKAVGSGLVQTGTVIGLYTPGELPIWNLANAPFGIADVWVGMRTWFDMRAAVPELADETRKRNVKVLLNFSTGTVDLLSKRPVLSAADLKGMKIRTTGGWTGLLKNLGATPVQIGFGELYQALDRGTVDAAINYIPLVKAYKFYEVAGHLTEVRMGQVLGYGVGINMDLYEKLSPENRLILDEVSLQAMDVFAENYITGASAAKADLIDGIDGKTVTFHQLPADEVARWQQASANFVDDWKAAVKDKGVDGDRIVATFEKIKAKYEKELATKGYPWAR